MTCAKSTLIQSVDSAGCVAISYAVLASMWDGGGAGALGREAAIAAFCTLSATGSLSANAQSGSGDNGATTHFFSLLPSPSPSLLVALVCWREDDISHKQQDDQEEGGLTQDESLGKGQV